ncbi:hypothetical protein JOC78_001418 [Bacillus ectoiniformans]|uniref:hypothetical protein n=1 Tax=Bacillus ectoiniformans TaxID=1494429 RepID=UPI00195BA299|nr:hypothetical protein [Bacillus ectoiniformans]MBM7648472.1 hypothetical protein [Bacillus ectoiniformans]
MNPPFSDLIDEVLPLLDILTIFLLEDDPIIGIVLVAILRAITKDKIVKLSFILLIIVLGVSQKE